MFPRSTPETFAQKLFQTFKNHRRFKKPKLSRTDFTIDHYAGEVKYGADHFLDKNKDYMVAEHNRLLYASKCPFVVNLLPEQTAETKKTKFSSIGTRFKGQLQELMVTLGTTDPRYIRCVKPNSKLKPCILENTSIIQQLRCAGVLEAIRISCAGFPTRKTFSDFLHRFKILGKEYVDGSLEDKVACEKILDKMEMKRYQIGKTKVFLRAGQMAELDARRAEIVGRAAKKIQRKMRSHIAHNEFILLRKASIDIQSFCRGRLACNLYENMRRNDAAIKIQKYQRRHITLKLYNTYRSYAIVLEAGLRGMVARKEFRFRKESKAATSIQAKWRCHRDYSYYKSLQNAILTYQCSWRQKNSRKELKKLKIASRETGALKDAKDKLEKRVEELTLRLGLEKRRREDLEKEKEQEIAKLQEALHEMRLQVEEVNSLLSKEKETAKKAIEEAVPVIQEATVYLQDTEKIDSLSAEIEKLKELLQQEKNSIDVSRQEISSLRKENEKLLEELENARKQFDLHQETINRFEEKLLNSESENQVLRQQAISLASTNKDLSQQLTSALAQQRLPEKSSADNGEENTNTGLSHLSNLADQEKEEKPHRLLNEKKLQENQEFLIEIITHDVGFSNGRPVSACIVFKSLLHWGSFEMEKTGVFENIIQKISNEIEEAGKSVLSYWLSNSSMLLLLLQRTLKAGHSTNKRRSTSSSILWGKLSQGTKSSSSNIGLKSSGRAYIGVNNTPQVEAKYPALLFKQQLTAFIEKIYGIIRDDLKKEISSYLGKCIQAPRTSRVVNTAKGSRSEAKSTAQQALLAHWHTIVAILENYLKIMKEKYVQPFLIRKMFAQVFSFINVQLFNSLLLRRECCSFSNGEYLKTGLGEFESWCKDTTEVYAGASWIELKHIRQAVSFLVTHQKAKKSLKEITDDLCPDLSMQQLYRISTMYYDDIYGTHTVSNEVISKMKILMKEISNDSDTGSFLLDDDSSIPFSVDDISRSKSLAPIDITDIEPPPIIRQNSGFHFLKPRGIE
ncbi:Myosin-17 [Zostera marina]|uniref:Myosin-17 n=1 Tax=Zostera marina TaxID=29655 RepID=A0A0K9PPN3_ZOSMR|nr:Myosin-17 [Zostera marina]